MPDVEWNGYNFDPKPPKEPPSQWYACQGCGGMFEVSQLRILRRATVILCNQCGT